MLLYVLLLLSHLLLHYITPGPYYFCIERAQHVAVAAVGEHDVVHDYELKMSPCKYGVKTQTKTINFYFRRSYTIV